MGLILVTKPAVEPVSLSQAKVHLRVDADDDDLLITALISSARRYVERFTRRALITQTWRLNLDAIPRGDVKILPAPVQSVTSIGYTDSLGTLFSVPVNTYPLDLESEPARLGLSSLYGDWDAYNKLSITFVAGYGDDPEDVEETLVQAVLLLIGHWYANREGVIGTNFLQAPHTIDSILSMYQVPVLA